MNELPAYTTNFASSDIRDNNGLEFGKRILGISVEVEYNND
jgi:hypothetical protein